MPEEQLKAFLEAVKADAGLQKKLKADADAVATITKAAGFMISAEELKKAQAEPSEEDLEGVADGNGFAHLINGSVDWQLRPFSNHQLQPIPQSPCKHRGFYFFSYANKPANQHPTPDTITINATQRKPPQYPSPRFHPYPLNAFTNTFAHYRRHGGHSLAQISPPPDTTSQGFGRGSDQTQAEAA